MLLEEVLPKIINNTWDVKAALARRRPAKSHCRHENRKNYSSATLAEYEAKLQQ